MKGVKEVKQALRRIKTDERGSAYAWLTFFVFMWVFGVIWFFFIDPLYSASLETAKNSGFTSLKGGDAFYGVYETLYPILPFLMIFFAVIAFLKYASDIKSRWE